MAAPFFIRAARAGFRTVEPEVEEAARIDGAAETVVLRRVTLPLAAPALGAGLVLAWARALGEFGATILFAGNLEGRTQTLPLLVYSQFQDSLEAALAAATILVLAAFGVLIAVRLLRWPSGRWAGPTEPGPTDPQSAPRPMSMTPTTARATPAMRTGPSRSCRKRRASRAVPMGYSDDEHDHHGQLAQRRWPGRRRGCPPKSATPPSEPMSRAARGTTRSASRRPSGQATTTTSATLATPATLMTNSGHQTSPPAAVGGVDARGRSRRSPGWRPG